MKDPIDDLVYSGTKILEKLLDDEQDALLLQ